ncbi:MAG: sugar ABC transporter substrate-binding protein [Bacillota bacterium]
MKKFAVLTLSFIFLLTVSACGSEEIDVGIVLPTNDEPRWVQDEERFEELLEDTEYSVEILFSDGETSTERENVETLIQQGIDVLIIAAHDGAGAARAAEMAKEEGITVIAYDRLITDTDAVDYYVTFDSIAVGEAQAQYLVDQVEDGSTGNPLYLYAGASSDNNAFLFFEGAWNVLQPKIEDGTFDVINSSEARDLSDTADLSREQMSDIMGQIDTDWDFDTAKSLAENDLSEASSDEKGEVFILAPNDGTARNIGDEFKGDDDVSDYHITGQDAESESIQYIIDGDQSMTVFKDVRILVEDAYNMAISVLEDEDVETTGEYDNGEIEVPSKQTDVITVTRENVKEEIFDTDYYDIDEFDNTDDLD